MVIIGKTGGELDQEEIYGTLKVTTKKLKYKAEHMPYITGVTNLITY